MGDLVKPGDTGKSTTGINAPEFDGSQPCAQVDPDLFFYEGYSEMMKKAPTAKKICGTCNFINPCLDYALANDVEGIWGATTYSERKNLRKERGLPRPKPMSSVVDEIVKHLTK